MIKYTRLNIITKKGLYLFVYQEKGGYCYNSDTLFLYDFISSKDICGNVLDVGCGCGILGLLIKENFSIDLSGIDIQENNIIISKINAKNNNLQSKFIYNDFLEYDFNDKFDYIVSNPPFYRAKSKQSPNLSKKISRFNSNLPVEDFIKKSNSLLKPRGELIFCYDAGHFQEIVCMLFKYKLNLEEIRFIHPKQDKNATVVLIKSKKSSKSMVKCLPPLITHKNGIFSHEVESIYKKLNLKSLKCEMR